MLLQHTSPAVRRLAVAINSIRTFKRKPEYPKYRAEVVPLTHRKKDHSTFFKRHLKAWLGPQNIKGEYYRNKYYYPPQNNKPNYIVADGSPVVKTGQELHTASSYLRDPLRHPFPSNTHCTTNEIIPDNLKKKIYERVTIDKVLAQEMAHQLGLKLTRVEAVVRLQELERGLRQENKITSDMDKFAGVMKKIFPIFDQVKNGDNLTEIPTPHKTLHQRFLTISESEPFGPVDAAKIFDLEPAQQTLDRLTELKQETGASVAVKEVVVGQEREGDKNQFRFKMASSGNVGFRYGASRRDKKKNRAVGFDKLGRMVYAV